MQATKVKGLTIEEYKSLEEETGLKYEYHNGYAYAMSGGTLNHGLICGNIYGELRSALRESNSNCKALTSVVKLNIAQKNSFVYPDSMVICGKIEKSSQDLEAVTNPKVIVEVLSKSTSNYDRGEKFYMYRQIDSLEEYVLIEQNFPIVEIYTRKSDLWKIVRVEGMDKIITLSSIGISIKLSAIFEDVTFSNEQ